VDTIILSRVQIGKMTSPAGYFGAPILEGNRRKMAQNPLGKTPFPLCIIDTDRPVTLAELSKLVQLRLQDVHSPHDGEGQR
jgi:hypothetical protein